MAADVPTIKSIFQRPSHLKPQVPSDHHDSPTILLPQQQQQQHAHSDTELLGWSTNIPSPAKPSPRKLIRSAAAKEKALKKQCPGSWGDFSAQTDEDEKWLEKRRNEQRQQQQLEREQNYQLKESQRRWRQFQGESSLECSPSAIAVASAATAALASTNSFAFMSSKEVKQPKLGPAARLNIDTACTSSSSVVSISAATARFLSSTTPTPDGHSPHLGFGRRDVKSTSSSPRGQSSCSHPASPLRSPITMSPKARHAIVPAVSPRRGPVAFKSGSTGTHEPAWQQQKVVPMKLSQYRLWMFIIAAGTLVNGLLSVILIESFLGMGTGNRGPEDCSSGNCTSHRHFGGFVGSRVMFSDSKKQEMGDLLQLQQAILSREDDDSVSVLIMGKGSTVQDLKRLQQRVVSEDRHRELLAATGALGLGKAALEQDPRGTEVEEGLAGDGGEERTEEEERLLKLQREERMRLVKDLADARAGVMGSLLDMGWVITPHSEVPGVFVLERREDFSTALLVQDVCYLFTVGKSTLHNHYTGIWFAKENMGGNLSTFTSQLEASAEEGDPLHGGEGVQSSGLSAGIPGVPASVVRDLSQINLSKNVCSAFQPNRADDPSRYPVSPTSTTTIDAMDLPVLLQRANKSYGRMVGPKGLQEFVLGSSATAKKKLRTGSEGFEERQVAVVGRYDSHVGHFGESVLPMLEVAQHFVTGSPASAGKERSARRGLPPDNITLFFPSDKELRSNWSVSIGQLLFGSSSQALAGRIEGRPVCFKFAFFLMNARHLNSSVQGLRDRSWGMVDWANAILLSARTGVKEEEIERAEEEREEEEKTLWWEQGSRKMRGFSRGEGRVEDLPEEGAVSYKSTVRELSRGTAEKEVKRIEQDGRIPRLEHTLRKFYPGWPPVQSTGEGLPSARPGREGDGIPVRRWQVTVIEREGQRTVSNMRSVMEAVRRRFPDIPVERVRFAQASLIEQVAIMQHSALMVSMHGATLSNVIFLPRGSTVLEMFPYLFESESYMGLCRRGGVVYLRWQNGHLENSTYTNNCMREKGYDVLGMSQCRHNRECLFCARDRSITAVNIDELDAVLAKAQNSVRSFLSKHGSPMYKRTRVSTQ